MSTHQFFLEMLHNWCCLHLLRSSHLKTAGLLIMIRKQFASPDLINWNLESHSTRKTGPCLHQRGAPLLGLRCWPTLHLGLALVLVEDQKSLMSLACKLYKAIKGQCYCRNSRIMRPRCHPLPRGSFGLTHPEQCLSMCSCSPTARLPRATSGPWAVLEHPRNTNHFVPPPELLSETRPDFLVQHGTTVVQRS